MIRIALITIMLSFSSYSYAGLCSYFLSKSTKNTATTSTLDAIKVTTLPIQEVAKKFSATSYHSPEPKNIAPTNTPLSEVLENFKPLSFFERLRTHTGKNNKGLLTLQTNNRKYFAKLFKKESYLNLNGKNNSPRVSATIGYQKLISDLGWGPQLYSLIIDGDKVIGIITEYIEGPLYHSGGHSAPINISEKQLQKVNGPLQIIENRTYALLKLGIIANDLQFILSNLNHQPYLIDTGGWAQSAYIEIPSAEEIEAILESAH